MKYCYNFILLIIIITLPVKATIIYVPSGELTIQAGIDAANNYDTVLVASGTYSGIGNYDINFLGKPIVVMSVSGYENTTIDVQVAQKSAFVFENGESNESKLIGFTIQGCYTGIRAYDLSLISNIELQFPAILCNYSSPTISNCKFIDNTSLFGGALFCLNDTTLIENCIFQNNRAWFNGGAIACISFSEIMINECQFLGNSNPTNQEGAGGGALFVYYSSSPTIYKSSFIGNSADLASGAIRFQFGGNSTIIESIFAYNSSNNAESTFGGVCCILEQHDVSFLNCTFYGNEARFGGHLHVHDGAGTITFDNSVLAGGLDGSALAFEDNATAPTFTCCDIYGNTDGDWELLIADQEGVNGNFSGNPLFVDPENNDFRLQFASPLRPNNNLCNLLIGALDVAEEQLSIEIVCPTEILNVMPDNDSLVCIPLPVISASPISLDIGNATWENDTLCFKVNGEGLVDLFLVFTNWYEVDTCELTVNVTGPLITCPTDTFWVTPDENHEVKAEFPIETNSIMLISVAGGDWINDTLFFTPDSGGIHNLTVNAVNNFGEDHCQAVFVVNTEIECPLTIFNECRPPFIDYCFPLTIVGAAANQLSIGYGHWENDILCFYVDTSGYYTIPIVSENSHSKDSCLVEVNIRLPKTVRVPLDYPTIREAMNASICDNDTILVDDGIYQGTDNKNLNFNGKRIYIHSVNGPENTIIDCEGEPWSTTVNGFIFNNGEDNSSILEGFKIINASGFMDAGAILIDNESSPIIRNCILEKNWAGQAGAGIAIENNSNPSIENCLFQYNSTDDKGAGLAIRGSSPVISNCTFNQNSSPYGGAIYCEGPDVWGGYLFDCSPDIIYSIFTRNWSFSGAIMSHGGANPTVANCTFYANGADYGSGIYIWDATVIIEKTIFAFGEASYSGAIYGETPTDVPSISCTNIFGNASGDWIDNISDLLSVNGNLSVDPLFCDTTSFLDPDYLSEPEDYYMGGDFGLSNLSECDAANNSCQLLIGASADLCNFTPVGQNVNVEDNDGVSITFENVTNEGYTAVDIQNDGPGVAEGYTTVPSSPMTYYNITTTATYEGQIEICLSYDETLILGDESELKLMHHTGTVWIDITSNLDMDNNIICGLTTTLSPFIISQVDAVCCVHRGDLNHSGGDIPADITDLTYLIDYMFQQGPPPVCMEEGNVNGIGVLDIVDLTYLVDFMFRAGTPPPACDL